MTHTHTPCTTCLLVKLLVDTLDSGEGLAAVPLLDSDVDQLVSSAANSSAQLPVRERVWTERKE